MVFFGVVREIYTDSDGGERIRAYIDRVDDKSAEIPFAFPLLPKTIHSKPKVGEAVLIFCVNDNPHLQRFYIGPIISQYQNLFKDRYYDGALKLLGGDGKIEPDVINIPQTHGAFAGHNDVAIYGRKNSDIILGESDVRIRCGARLIDNLQKDNISFNKRNPSFIKLKYHEQPYSIQKKVWVKDHFEDKYDTEKLESSLSLVAQEINLISTSGNPDINVSHTDITNQASENKGEEGITDKELMQFIKDAHPMVYGDELVKFLHLLVRAFISHTHRYNQMPPIPDENYNTMQKYNLNDILSKNIRIN